MSDMYGLQDDENTSAPDDNNNDSPNSNDSGDDIEAGDIGPGGPSENDDVEDAGDANPFGEPSLSSGDSSLSDNAGPSFPPGLNGVNFESTNTPSEGASSSLSPRAERSTSNQAASGTKASVGIMKVFDSPALMGNIGLGVAVVLFVLVHFLNTRLRNMSKIHIQILSSCANGLVVAYVFLQGLPALAESRDAIIKSVAYPLFQNGQYQTMFVLGMMMLFGVLAYYAVDKIGEQRRGDNSERGPVAFGFYTAFAASLNFGIGYCLPNLQAVSLGVFLLYVAMMSIFIFRHGFVVGRLFEKRPAYIFPGAMAFALILGMGLSILGGADILLSKSLVLSYMFGGILALTLTQELAQDSQNHKSHYPSFLMSAGFQAIITLLVVLLANIR